MAGSTIYEKEFTKPVIDKSILFLGFDFRYTGNSRYLFEEMIRDKRFKNRNIRFVTDDESVDEQYRVTLKSDDYYRWIARAEVIIAESWIPGNIKKRDEAVFIQLWHGTPLKKVLFDSSESEIMRVRDGHKVSKHRNIMNWDYLLADSKIAADKFNSAFLMPKERTLQAGYPRVKYLIEHRSDEKYKTNIKRKIGFSKKMMAKKTVLYAPTWRDYNYGKPVDQQNLDYVVDLSELSKALGDGYVVLHRDHHFLSELPGVMSENCIDVSGYETQELVLIADHLVTDFSSVLFDAFAIDTPVTLFVTDYERYQRSRGVYDDVWEDLKTLSVDNEKDLAQAIKKYIPMKEYKKYSKKYGYESKVSLIDFVYELDVKKMNRDW